MLFVFKRRDQNCVWCKFVFMFHSVSFYRFVRKLVEFNAKQQSIYLCKTNLNRTGGLNTMTRAINTDEIWIHFINPCYCILQKTFETRETTMKLKIISKIIQQNKTCFQNLFSITRVKNIKSNLITLEISVKEKRKHLLEFLALNFVNIFCCINTNVWYYCLISLNNTSSHFYRSNIYRCHTRNNMWSQRS